MFLHIHCVSSFLSSYSNTLNPPAPNEIIPQSAFTDTVWFSLSLFYSVCACVCVRERKRRLIWQGVTLHSILPLERKTSHTHAHSHTRTEATKGHKHNLLASFLLIVDCNFVF
uniref:Uncharacterized protein n=1 Tax=Gouania willdenowi TaxID=441366 RepID=A0A8C5H0H6_GOUWI